MIDLKALQGQVKLLVDRPRAGRGRARRPAGRAAARVRRGVRKPPNGRHVRDLAAPTCSTRPRWPGCSGCVFVRFCEDNGLVEPVWIGGDDPQAPATARLPGPPGVSRQEPAAQRPALAARGVRLPARPARHRADLRRAQPAVALRHLRRRRRGAARLLPPSAPGRCRCATPGLDTRFLGDLYQDLSAHARETYALLQTPEFVEEFILDRAFEPAVTEFGLAGD